MLSPKAFRENIRKKYVCVDRSPDICHDNSADADEFNDFTLIQFILPSTWYSMKNVCSKPPSKFLSQFTKTSFTNGVTEKLIGMLGGPAKYNVEH